jgi:hypothetical protein
MATPPVAVDAIELALYCLERAHPERKRQFCHLCALSGLRAARSAEGQADRHPVTATARSQQVPLCELCAPLSELCVEKCGAATKIGVAGEAPSVKRL